MSVVNWVLIQAGQAALAAWHALGAFFIWLGGWIDWALEPVLSPALRFVNPALTAAGNVVYALLSPLPAWAGLVLLSAITGVVMLVAFRYTSNQAAIGRARDQITANLLALKLFKEDFGVALRAQRRALAALGRLQWHMLRPVLIMLLPMVLVLAQMGLRYQWRPLNPGERTLLRVRVNPALEAPPAATLAPSAGVAEAVGPVPGGGELVWRITAGQPGRYVLKIRAGDETVDKELVVGAPFERVSAERPGREWLAQLLHPVEAPLPARGPVQHVSIVYGGVDSWVCGPDWWILTFFVVSMVFALLFKPLFRVRF